jgi:diketogulonate reductase-like aldo/keto reductase
VALGFLTRRSSVLAIPKSVTPEHTVENAAGGDLRLTASEIAEIDAAFPAGPPQRVLPMLQAGRLDGVAPNIGYR